MIEVRTGARLHFGLLSPGRDAGWSNVDGERIAARSFGGIGLMVDEPGIVLRVEPALFWSASGPLYERALDFARLFKTSLPGVKPHAIIVERIAPEHCGLGVGTQFGLAVAKALALAGGQPGWNAVELAGRVGRGRRSAVGVHGFEHGGLIVEGGKQGTEAVAPLLVREQLPGPWRIVVAIPSLGPGVHGKAEQLIFDQLSDQPAPTEALCRLVMLGMLPALKEQDCRAFGEALYDFNARVGDFFAEAQGGRYAHPMCGELVKFIRSLDMRGVGQSSWGPTIFAVVEDEQKGADVVGRVRERFGESVQLWLTRPSGGAVVTA